MEQGLVVGERGEDETRRARVQRADLPAGLDAVAVLEPHVEDRDVGIEGVHSADGLLLRGGLTDHLDVVLGVEQIGDAPPHDLVVVEQEHRDRLGHGPIISSRERRRERAVRHGAHRRRSRALPATAEHAAKGVFTSLIVAAAATAHDRPSIVSRLPVETLTVAEDRDVAATIVEHVRSREGALLVMTTGGTFLLTKARRSITNDVLERLRQPVLLLGAHCAQPVRLDASTLAVGVDPSRDERPAVEIVRSWRKTFGSSRVLLVDVVAESSWPAAAADDAARERAEATAHTIPGIDAETTVLQSNDPAAALVAFGERHDDAILVLTSDRWPGRSHWYSTTRRVVQLSSRPVLVVPSDL